MTPGTTGTTRIPDSNMLALDRTRMAYERTLMAWVRTSTSLISFGFTIYKFFDYVHESQTRVPDPRLFGPREFAMLMISLGIVALVFATFDHRRNLQALRAAYGPVQYSVASLLAGLMSVLGLVSLIAVLFRQ
jgi:putative membrane protein